MAGKKSFVNLSRGLSINIDDTSASNETKVIVHHAEETGKKEDVLAAAQAIEKDANLPEKTRGDLLDTLKTNYLSLFDPENLPEDYSSLKSEAKFLFGMTNVSLGLMAMRLKKIRDNRLYEEDGYSDFRAFIDKEFEQSRATIYRYIDLIAEFGVNLFHLQVDYSKLYPILPVLKNPNLEEGDREKIKTQYVLDAKTKSFRDLEREVESIKKEFGLNTVHKTVKPVVKHTRYSRVITAFKKNLPLDPDEDEKQEIREFMEFLRVLAG